MTDCGAGGSEHFPTLHYGGDAAARKRDPEAGLGAVEDGGGRGGGGVECDGKDGGAGGIVDGSTGAGGESIAGGSRGGDSISVISEGPVSLSSFVGGVSRRSFAGISTSASAFAMAGSRDNVSTITRDTRDNVSAISVRSRDNLSHVSRGMRESHSLGGDALSHGGVSRYGEDDNGSSVLEVDGTLPHEPGASEVPRVADTSTSSSGMDEVGGGSDGEHAERLEDGHQAALVALAPVGLDGPTDVGSPNGSSDQVFVDAATPGQAVATADTPTDAEATLSPLSSTAMPLAAGGSPSTSSPPPPPPPPPQPFQLPDDAWAASLEADRAALREFLADPGTSPDESHA